jgi:hypothetical protein
MRVLAPPENVLPAKFDDYIDHGIFVDREGENRIYF